MWREVSPDGFKYCFEVPTTFLLLRRNGCIFATGNTGKTLASLWAADAVMRDHEARGEVCRALIVAPLSTLQTVWADAIFANFMKRRKCVVLHGSADKRLAALVQPADFYLINHDGIKVGARRTKQKRIELTPGGFAAALADRSDIQMVIVDEVGAYRDYTSLRSRVARKVLSPRNYLWLLTGTPTPNGPEDAYGIAVILNGAHGEMFKDYKRRVMYQVSQWKWVPRAGANEEAQKLMAPAIRFPIEACVDLPPLVTQTREVELSDEQTKYLKNIKKDLMLEIAKGTVTVANEAALRIKMMQIACGAIYDADHVAHRIDAKPRLAALKEIIEEAGSKVIIFSPFISVVNMLNEVLHNYSKAVIVGDTPVKERTEIIRAFQQTKDPWIINAHPETISHGQTLTAAATIVWFGPTDKTDVYIQACKRIHRPGQQRPCTVVNLASTKVEREVYRRLENNESLQGLLLKMVEDKAL